MMNPIITRMFARLRTAPLSPAERLAALRCAALAGDRGAVARIAAIASSGPPGVLRHDAGRVLLELRHRGITGG